MGGTKQTLGTQSYVYTFGHFPCHGQNLIEFHSIVKNIQLK